jgi:surface antigen
MKCWPSAFGHASVVVSVRMFSIALLTAVAACASPGPEGVTHDNLAELPAYNAYDGLPDSSDAWSDRNFSLDAFSKSTAAAAAPVYDAESMAATKASYSGLRPKIVTPRRPLQCVPYARMVSGIALRGDASTWWESAAGRFRRGQEPAPGAVLVIKGNSKTPHGHVGVVTKVINEREILIDHANWLNNQKIHLATPVIDVSPNNDWSAVRVWYTPGARYGANVYPTDGFIYADAPHVFVTVADANVRAQPTTKAKKIATLPRRAKVEVLGKVPGAPWYRIVHDGSEIGYVHAKLVKSTS